MIGTYGNLEVCGSNYNMDHRLDERAGSWGVLTPSSWETASLNHKFIRGDEHCCTDGAPRTRPTVFKWHRCRAWVSTHPLRRQCFFWGEDTPCSLSGCGDGFVRVNVLQLNLSIGCIAAMLPNIAFLSRMLISLFIFQRMRENRVTCPLWCRLCAVTYSEMGRTALGKIVAWINHSFGSVAPLFGVVCYKWCRTVVAMLTDCFGKRIAGEWTDAIPDFGQFYLLTLRGEIY